MCPRPNGHMGAQVAVVGCLAGLDHYSGQDQRGGRTHQAHHRCLSGHVLGQGIGQSGHVSGHALGQVFELTSVGQGAGQVSGHMRVVWNTMCYLNRESKFCNRRIVISYEDSGIPKALVLRTLTPWVLSFLSILL